jgi:hypothetical protein
MNVVRSDALPSRDMEAVGVALDGRVEPGCRIVEFSQEAGGGGGGVVAGENLFEQLARSAGASVSGRMTVCGSPSPTTCR